MQQYRLTFNLASSLGTPLHADTIFGHLCWGLVYSEGEQALTDFLAAFKIGAPLLVSDGFPAILDTDKPVYYLPYPSLPLKPGHYDNVRQRLNVSETDREEMVSFASAWKKATRSRFISENALFPLTGNMDITALVTSIFTLKVCPISMSLREGPMACRNWKECPGLGATGEQDAVCPVQRLRTVTSPVTHNVLNRWSGASENLYVQQDVFYNHGFHLYVRLDDNVMTLDRFKRCFEYIEHSGFGRDSSSGKGAIKDIHIEESKFPIVPGANAFLNLSSAYVPCADEIGKGSYATHVKHGKLGGSFAITHSPWKKPMLMLKAGSVLAGDPDAVHGCLIDDVHYQLPEIRQYGYAYPLGVKANV